MIDIKACELINKVMRYVDCKEMLHRINVENTSNSVSTFDNICVDFKLDQKHVWDIYNQETTITNIHKITEVRFRIVCRDKIESIIMFEQIEQMLKMTKKLFSFNYEIALTAYNQKCTHGILRKMKRLAYEEQAIESIAYNDLKQENEEIKSQLVSEINFFKSKDWIQRCENYRELQKDIYKLNEKLKKPKNAFIISKLRTSELRKEDITKYPELIESMEIIEMIKLIA